MSWLKSDPRKPPPPPKHVNLVHLMAVGSAMAARGEPVKHIDYIRRHGPKLELDQWGQPLPLSSMAQFQLDKMAAILREPLERTQALLLCGQLDADDVDAVKSVYPQVYAAVSDAALTDLLNTKPPYKTWAVVMLGVLFQKPADKMYSDAQQADDSEQKISGGGGSIRPDATPTQSDRREPAVRQQR